MTEPSRLRLRSVRFKDGRAPLKVLHRKDGDDYESVLAWVRACLDAHRRGDKESSNIAGFAFMVWATDGSSVCEAQNNSGLIPTIMIPDFVRNRLLAKRIEEWTIETLNGPRCK
jgi:hypothetical protein